jgi:hypothetical protein
VLCEAHDAYNEADQCPGVLHLTFMSCLVYLSLLSTPRPPRSWSVWSLSLLILITCWCLIGLCDGIDVCDEADMWVCASTSCVAPWRLESVTCSDLQCPGV